MQSPALRHLIVLTLLLSGAIAVFALNGYSIANVGQSTGYSYVADLDYWQSTNREQLVQATVPIDLAHDLNALPLDIGRWRGVDVPETNIEVFILLEPDQLIRRRYENGAGQHVWLTLIGGRQSRSFHPPDLCYDADGWNTSLASQSISLDHGGEIHGLWLEAKKHIDDAAAVTEHRVFYFYLFPNQQRNQQDGIILFRLTSPEYGSSEDTLAVQADLLRHFFSEATPNERAL